MRSSRLVPESPVESIQRAMPISTTEPPMYSPSLRQPPTDTLQPRISKPPERTAPSRLQI